MNLESFAKIDESARVQGVALIPRISRNHNLYTKEELKRFDNVTVPLNWEHNPDKVIGEVTFHYNEENETVYYEGLIIDPSASILAKNKVLYTSIEATPISIKQICNGTTDCFSMPYGLIPEGLALTETPGVPETSVIIEKYIAECNNHEFHKYGATDLIHKTITRDNKDESLNKVMQDRFLDMEKNLEEQISYKDEALKLFKKMAESNKDNMILDQISMLENDMAFLTNQLIKLRKDSDFIPVESLGNVVNNMKERYLCSCCGDLKKKLT